MTLTATIGFPRIGAKRELKTATENYWKGSITAAEFNAHCAKLRAGNWKIQQDNQIDIIPSGDFSLYDQMLDLTAALGAVPPRFEWSEEFVSTDLYFELARGTKTAKAMEMTKWFDTNYHYIVPEFYDNQTFKLSNHKYLDEFLEAKEQGIHTRPVIIGPVTYLLLGKVKTGNETPAELIDRLLPAYCDLLAELYKAGADWVQIEEPILTILSPEEAGDIFTKAYRAFHKTGLKILLTTYFESVESH
jgi:5-methyltetrahydropteroyltriglutamate--homocysteine methyltransferase